MSEENPTNQEILAMNPSELGRWMYNNELYWLDTTCVYCGGGEAYHLDHVIPKSRGGKEGKNLVPGCHDCNTRKSNRTPEEWIGVPNESIYKGCPRHKLFANARFEAGKPR
jgi:hypothetical protein